MLCYFYSERLLGILPVILKLNFRLQNSDFKFQVSEVPTDLLNRYIFVCQMDGHSEGPIHTLTCLFVDSILYQCVRHWPNIKTTLI